MASAAGFEPTAPRFIPLRVSPPHCAFVVWTVPSPWARAFVRPTVRCHPSSLYTFPACAGLGSGSAWRERPQLSPTLSGSAARFPVATPNFQLGISCSILLSYADILLHSL